MSGLKGLLLKTIVVFIIGIITLKLCLDPKHVVPQEKNISLKKSLVRSKPGSDTDLDFSLFLESCK